MNDRPRVLARDALSRVWIGLLWLMVGGLMGGAGLELGWGKETRPNILFAIADDASFQHFGAYGCDWVETPAFDRVARQGVLFTRAYTPNAKCAPSRATILTGRYSWQLEEGANHVCHFPAKFRAFPEVLRAEGYAVGMTGKGWAPGFAVDAQGKPRQMTGVPYQRRRMEPATPAMSPLDYAANFADFLDQVEDDQPWCFWYGGFEPHRGYEFGSGIRQGGKRLEQIDEVPGCWPDTEQVRTDLLDYAYEIEYFDQHLERMLNQLEAAGELDNTIVIVTADNGMPFPRVKGQTYEWSNHLPLAVMWPDGIRRPGRRVDALVSFIDFAPTVLEAAGISWESSGMAPSEGRSLTSWFQHDGVEAIAWRDHVLLGKERHDVGRPGDVGYPVRGIFDGRWLYLENFKPDRWPAGNPETGYLNCDGGPTKSLILELGREDRASAFWRLSFGKRPRFELYDVVQDPACLQNLAIPESQASPQRELAARLRAELTSQGDPRILGRGDIFDQYPYADTRTRGFYERFLAGEEIEAPWVNKTDFEPEPLDNSQDN